MIAIKAGRRVYRQALRVVLMEAAAMGNLAYRLFAASLIVLGAGVFAYMMRITYGATIEWDRKLLAIGMPLSFLIPAVAALMVAIGCAMFAHAWRSGRPSRF